MLVGEMLATRDAAIRAEASRPVSAVERPWKQLGAVESELTTTRNDLLDSWDQLRAMRGTVSWRITMPLRGVRRLVRRR